MNECSRLDCQGHLSQEREGAPDEPVLLNPFRRGLPATVRNAEQLAEFGKD